MKKILFCGIIMLSMLLSGCTRGICKVTNNFTYARPSSEKTYTYTVENVKGMCICLKL